MTLEKISTIATKGLKWLNKEKTTFSQYTLMHPAYGQYPQDIGDWYLNPILFAKI